MPQKINIDQCFKTFRNLPLEVSYQQVEKWVKEYGQSKNQMSEKPPHWILAFFNKWLRNK